jgi:DNA mismatch repair protein MutL
LDITRQLLPVDHQQGEGQGAVSIRGLISPPGLTRSSRSALHLIINRRVVQPRGSIAIVVEEAYNNLLAKGRHPFAVLNITVHPAAVDVNIHPTKSEVKFRDAPRVLGTVGRAVRDALLASGAPLWDADQKPDTQAAQRRFELRQIGGGWAQEQEQHPTNEWPQHTLSAEPHSLLPGSPATEQDLPHNAETTNSPSSVLPFSIPALAGLRILGQANNTCIVADSPAGIVLIDQHAAHERVIYEHMQSQHAVHRVATHQCIQALTIDFTPETQQFLLLHAPDLAEWGLAIEDFGVALRIRSTPIGLPEHRVASVLHELATIITQTGQKNTTVPEILPALLAHHMAVQIGQILSLEEIQGLVTDLSRCQEYTRCPHGHPIIVILDTNQIARWFGQAK